MTALMGTFVKVGTMADLKKRFDAKWIRVDATGCHEWQACLMPRGYGAIQFGGKKLGAHRASWLIHFGEIPNGVYVCHKCDNRKCVNPDHLFLGSPKDNACDMQRKGRKFIPAGEANAMYKITPDVRDAVAKEYIESNLTTREIADMHSISTTSALSICGGYRRGKSGPRNPNAKMTSEIAERIREMRRNGAFIKDICAAVGLSRTPVESVIKGESWV